MRSESTSLRRMRGMLCGVCVMLGSLTAFAEQPASTGEPVATQCFPACRKGFVCGLEGTCVSACNPACGPAERCTAEGECVLAAPAEPEAPPERGVETHDGVLLRMAGGLAVGAMSSEPDGAAAALASDASAAGGGLMGSVDVGWGLTNELSIQGRLGLLWIFDPELESDDEEVELPYQTSLTALIMGVGLTYNVMPLNLYVTGVAGVHFVGLYFDENDRDFVEDDREDLEGGFALNLDVGKEWWVTTQTGMGIAGRFWWGTGGVENDLPGPGTVESDRELFAFGVLLSITHQ
jgi:hypothetical protein